MRKIAIVVTGVLAVATFAGTAAADVTATGIELGLRSGYSIPMGTLANGNAANPNASISQSDIFSGKIPFWFDAGYRATPNFYVGLFFEYGLVFIPNNNTTGCGTGGVSCSGHDLMYGIDAHYHFIPDGPLDPWLGLGFGYESITASASGTNASGDLTFTGFQFVDFQLGADYKFFPNLAVGPFAMFSLGQYSSISQSSGSLSGSQDIQNKAMHEWLTIGIRGEYDINLGN
jgi:hypothetical protein